MTTTRPWVLGINSSHNGSACLLWGDRIIAAIQEERLVRRKRSRVAAGLPFLSAPYCLQAAGIQAKDLALIVVATQSPASSSHNDVRLNPILQVVQNNVPTMMITNHLAHAYSAFATSGLSDAAVLVVDGMGSPLEDFSEEERRAIFNDCSNGWEAISLYQAVGNEIRAVRKYLVENGQWLVLRGSGMPCFRTLGGMYAAAAKQIFGDPTEAGKVMGLAPYGKPLISVEKFFTISNGQFDFHDDVPAMFTNDNHWPSNKVDYENLSASTQAALEHGLSYLTRESQELTGVRNLCYAGGVALNSVANEKIISNGDFENVFIYPAAEDSGAAVGAAYYGLWKLVGSRRTVFRLRNDACGASYSMPKIENALAATPGIETLVVENVIDATAKMLCDGKIIGWFQGGAELGPRALGQRSILYDPRIPDGKATLNGKVKHREYFRPFAPAILQDEVEKWFECSKLADSPFMLRVCRFRPEVISKIPSVVHVDGTGRLQTVSAQDNHRFYQLIRRFFELSGVPMILNTSFNVMGEPIVETPNDALWCLLYTDLDACVLENVIVYKKDSFKSVLDLYPKSEIAKCRIDVDLKTGNRKFLQLPGILRFRIDTAWGPAEQQLPLSLLTILVDLDGSRNGWQILKDIQQSSTDVTGNDLIVMLAHLRRASAVSFSIAPVKRNFP